MPDWLIHVLQFVTAIFGVLVAAGWLATRLDKRMKEAEAKRAEFDASEAERESEWTWHQRWEECEEHRRRSQQEFEDRITMLVEQHRIELEASEAAWQARCIDLKESINKLAIRLTQYENGG